MPWPFTGKRLYEKTALYAAIQGAEEWRRSDSTGKAQRPKSTGSRVASAFVGPFENLVSARRRDYGAREKPS